MEKMTIGDISKKSEKLFSSFARKYTPAGDAVPGVFLIGPAERLSAADRTRVEQALGEESSLLFIEKPKKKLMPENSLFSVDAAFCLIRSEHYGRVQHALVVGAKNSQGPLPIPTEDLEDSLKLDESNEIHRKTIQRRKNQEEKVPPPRTAVEDSGQPVEALEAQDVLSWLANLEPAGKKERNLRSSQDIHPVNASLITGSITIQVRKDYRTKYNSTAASMYYSYNVELAAVVKPRRRKILKVTSVKTYVSITDGLTKNDWYDRGDGTYMGHMIFYPGSNYTFKKSEVHLPKGWRIIKIEPESPNSENQYTRTTGWTIGVEAGGEMPKDPKVAVKLSAEYNASKSYTRAFKDFTALNSSNSAVCEWKYVYTKVHRDWESIFSTWAKDIEAFPDLASTTMYLDNEVVYEVPENTNSKQDFVNYLAHLSLYAHSHMSWGVIYYGIKFDWGCHEWNKFSLNFGAVVFPT